MDHHASQIKKYQIELKAIEEELQDLPDGRLKIRKKYFAHVIEDKEISITKNATLIRQLCRKKFLLEKQRRLKYNLNPKCLVVNLKSIDPKTIIAALPDSYQDVPINYFYQTDVHKWRSMTPKKNPHQAEQLNYTSPNGIPLRSKSEFMIASLIEEYDVPYHYEASVKFEGKTIYPDFVIKSPFTGKLIIWEHFGALHQEGYIEKMNEKMKRYMKHGYVPFDNLIYTFEFDLMDEDHLKAIIEKIIL